MGVGAMASENYHSEFHMRPRAWHVFTDVGSCGTPVTNSYDCLLMPASLRSRGPRSDCRYPSVLPSLLLPLFDHLSSYAHNHAPKLVLHISTTRRDAVSKITITIITIIGDVLTLVGVVGSANNSQSGFWLFTGLGTLIVIYPFLVSLAQAWSMRAWWWLLIIWFTSVWIGPLVWGALGPGRPARQVM